MDIFELVSLVLYLIISWRFRLLAHEEEQYTDILSIAPKQTKAGPRSSRTPFLFYFILLLSANTMYINFILDVELS